MTSTTSSSTDIDLIGQAEAHYKEERLLQAARCLRQVQDLSLLEESHRKLLKNAEIVEQAVDELLSSPSGEWKKQGESHGHYDTSIYYKIAPGARLTCRMESPIPSSLLVPLLSVLNESSLYHTWIPSWTRPFKIGVRQSRQLLHDTRGHQIIQVQCDVPWPLVPREVLMDVIAVDDIDKNGFIIAKMRTIKDDVDLPDGFAMPPLERNMERADFDGAVLFRACPPDHPNYANARKKFSEDLILLQFTVYFDAHMAMVPHSAINFVTRTVMGKIWSMLLHVAEQVRDSEHNEHQTIIQQKADFYKWVEERCDFMLQEMQAKKKEGKQGENHTTWTMDEVMKLSM